jgi:hypothetical protein
MRRAVENRSRAINRARALQFHHFVPRIASRCACAHYLRLCAGLTDLRPFSEPRPEIGICATRGPKEFYSSHVVRATRAACHCGQPQPPPDTNMARLPLCFWREATARPTVGRRR